jgi:hypothetical protein
MLAAALASYSRAMSDQDPHEALLAADESLRLIDAGAGAAESAHSSVAMTAAILRSAEGDFNGAAQALLGAVRHEAQVGGRGLLAANLRVAVVVLAGTPNRFPAAATLAAAADGPMLGHYPKFLIGNQQDRYEHATTKIATNLGPDVYAEAQRRGAAMSYDEIIDFALLQLASQWE